MRPRVGLNLVFLVPGETGGMEIYARELISALHARGDVELVAFVNREAAAAGDDPWPGADETIVVPVHARNRVEWVRGEQQLLPPRARRARVDLVHSLGSTSPAWGRFRRVVTIQDLVYKIQPEAHLGVKGLGMRLLVPLAARRSDRILTPSRSTADDLVEHLHVPRERIDVVPLGLGATAVSTPLPEDEVRELLETSPERPIALSVSAKRPHKNFARLIDALALIPAERRPLLVLPGYATPHEAELRERAVSAGVAADVRFLGWIDVATLDGLYAASACFVFPSLYEGFGLPIVEAMARGLPVASSARGSLGEVAADAALLFDPEQPAQIAAAIERIIGDPAEAERLRAAGHERASRFTWESAAAGTLATYERVLSERGRE